MAAAIIRHVSGHPVSWPAGLTEEEDGRNKKADDEYLIRSGFLRDDLIEAIIVLPSVFYGNNVPACLAIINKRKPADRKDRVLMIWASRDYQHANPQSLLRRADCLRILLPWRPLVTWRKLLRSCPEFSKSLDSLMRSNTTELVFFRKSPKLTTR